MNLEFWIAWRYLATKRKEKFLGLISVIAIMGVVVGVAALMIVTAVMSGFSRDLRDKIIGNFAHIVVSNNAGIEDPQDLIKQLKSISDIQGVTPFIDGQALVRQDKSIFGVKIRGIDPQSVIGVSKIGEYLIYGDLSQLDPEAALVGKELAKVLGSKISLQVSKHEVHDLDIRGVFSSGMYEYDSEFVFLHLDKVKKMLDQDKVTGIAIKLNNLEKAGSVKEEIQRLLGYSYRVSTWMELNANFFAALKLEKITMFIMLCLIILVAAFNIISTLIVMVVQKTKDIGILKAIGMSRSQVRRIFTYEGLAIGFVGIGLGIGLGWLLCFLLARYQFVKLPADVYYLDHLPVYLSLWPDVTFIIIAALLITIFSTIYPALRAGRLNPVEALRYE